jgi:hypothetical protein
MGQKSNYLLWRQQDGIFTALDKKLKITMWSTVSGKIISQQSENRDHPSMTGEQRSMIKK